LGSSTKRWSKGYFAGTLYSNDLRPVNDYVIIARHRAGFLLTSPWYGNPLAFKTPYKAEQYDYATGSWTDVTNSYTWKYATDMLSTTRVDSGVKSPDGTEVSWRVRLWYDLGGGYRYVHGILIILQHTSYLKEVVLEASRYSDFSADVVTLKSFSGSVSVWDGGFLTTVEADIADRRYVRLTLTLSTTNTSYSIKIKQIALINLAPSGVFFESLLPFGYDSDRNITVYGYIRPNTDNAQDLGSSALRWANVYAVNVITGDLCFEEKVCEICGKQFEEGEELVLKVKKVDDVTRTIPIHLKCSDAYKQIDERLRKLEVSANG